MQKLGRVDAARLATNVTDLPLDFIAARLRHFLSNNLLNNMGQCFGDTHLYPIGNDFKRILKKSLVIKNSFLQKSLSINKILNLFQFSRSLEY